MKRLTIFTQNHKAALTDFANEVGGHFVGDRAKITWETKHTYNMASKLVIFLEESVMRDNPIYNQSEKLCEMVRNLRTTPSHENEVKKLCAFLRTSRELNIEGYILFRMCEFRHMLDIMSYRVMKKMLVINPIVW